MAIHDSEFSMRIAVILAIFGLLALTSPLYACGPTSNCVVDDNRYYRIRMPEGHDSKTPVGAIFFAHSLKATAVGTIRNKNLIKMASRLGVALVALKSAGDDWNIKNSPANRSLRSSDEFSYFDNVIHDVSTRFAIDTSRLMLVGSSVGGHMTWKMACDRGDRFAGFVPIAGSFWLNPPKSCTSAPANVIHVHGIADKIVPLEGRKVGTSRHSNIHDLLAAYARIGGYKKTRNSMPLDLECSESINSDGRILDFCLHAGGHIYKASHIMYAWKRFQGLGAL